MQWIHSYQFFLFDLDGLLVDTEPLHYTAYLKMCAHRGFTLQWDFERYSQASHHTANGMRDQVYTALPGLYAQEPNWHVLYQETKSHFLHLLTTYSVSLMPGVSPLLLTLQDANINRCVVTNSSATVVHAIRQQNVILDTIDYWITREHYINPKPDSECYDIAIKKFAKEHDRIIGFEDSPRGFKALSHTRAEAVLICPVDADYLPQMGPNIRHYCSFTDLNEAWRVI